MLVPTHFFPILPWPWLKKVCYMCATLMITVLNPLKAQDVADTITLSPEDNSKAWDSRNLLPTESATLTVEVNSTGTNDGKDYTIKGSPSVSFESGNTLWSTVSTDATSVVIKALNGGREPETAVAVVSATWSTESTSAASGGGSGTGSAEELLEGYVRAYAYSQRTTFTWTFTSRMQFANGTDTIDFTVAAAAGGATLDMPKFAITGPAGWTIQYSASNTEITGTVKSTTPGKGALKIMYDGLEQGSSEDEIAFAKSDLAIASIGKEPNLKEDRQPGGGNAPAPHEMDPGGVVLVPMEDANGTVLTPGKRTKLTITGNGSQFTEGDYKLTADGTLSKAKIYPAATGGTPITLPKTYTGTELANPVTLYVGSDSFTPIDTAQNGSLTLTYDLTLGNDSAKPQLEDKIRLLLLPVKVNCPELYLFSGHTGDKVELCKASGICQWKLKNASPVIGTFDHPTNLACGFSATTVGNNTIQLVIGGNVIWEKPTEIIEIISRAAWGAYAADTAKLTTTPTLNGITFHHSSNTNDGATEVLDIQDMHMQKSIIYWHRDGDGWGDIGYHFLLDKSGNVYQGRELESVPGMTNGPYTLGSHVEMNNTAAGIGVCILGDYHGTEAFPASRQKSLEKALSAIARRYKLTSDKVSYHQARATTNPTECPGSNVISKATDIIENIEKNLQ